MLGSCCLDNAEFLWWSSLVQKKVYIPQIINQIVENSDLIGHTVDALNVFRPLIQGFHLALQFDVLQLQLLIAVSKKRVLQKRTEFALVLF